MEGVTVIGSCSRMSRNIRGRGCLTDTIPVKTIELAQRRFQVFDEISLLEKLIGMSYSPQYRTFITEEVLGYRISCEINAPWAGKKEYCNSGTERL